MNLRKAFLALLAATAAANIETPVIGCFTEGGRAHEVLGVAGNFIVRDAEDCAETANEWSIEGEVDGKWLLKRDPASGAVEHREKLRDGRFIVWPDGRLADLGELDLPGEFRSARLLSANWYRLVLDDGTNVALARNGRWFLLPGVPQ